jgi:hypothetical protein
LSSKRSSSLSRRYSLSVSSRVCPGLFPECERPGDRGQHKRRIPDRRQVDHEDACGEPLDQLGAELKGKPRLAGPAGPREGDETDVGAADQLPELGDLALPAEQRRQLGGQIGRARPERPQ